MLLVKRILGRNLFLSVAKVGWEQTSTQAGRGPGPAPC